MNNQVAAVAAVLRTLQRFFPGRNDDELELAPAITVLESVLRGMWEERDR